MADILDKDFKTTTFKTLKNQRHGEYQENDM